MFKKNWTRRDFIRAAGISASAATLSTILPTLSTEAFAQTSAPGAKRILLLNTGNGTILPNWRSNGTGTPFTAGGALPELMGPILEPLNAFRDKMLMLDGIDMSAIYQGEDWRRVGLGGHGAATVVWTGEVTGDSPFPQATSLDVLLNNAIGEGRSSIHVATRSNNQENSPTQTYSFDENATPIFPSFNPETTFDSIFGTGISNNVGGRSSRRLSQRERTLSLLRGELTRLKPQLPTIDRERLDIHLETLDALEEKIRVSSQPIVCDVTTADRPNNPSGRSKYWHNATLETSDLFGEIIAKAFACDQARVAQWTLAPETSFTHLDRIIPEAASSILDDLRLHNVTHMTRGESAQAVEARRLVTLYNRWCAERVANVLTQLEANGVFEDTIVVWAMNQQHAGVHSNRNCPFIVFQGSAQGPFDAGRYMRWGSYDQDAVCLDSNSCERGAGNESNNNLMITLAHAMGVQSMTSIGNANHCRATGLDADLLV